MLKTTKGYQILRAQRVAALLVTIVALSLLWNSAVAEADGIAKSDSLQSATSTLQLGSPAVTRDALAGYVAGESVFPSFLKISLALLAVIVGIYLTLALLKRAMGRKVSGSGKANAIQVIETCYLAPKRSISLVKVGSRGALLSVSDSSIATLMELSSEETSEIVKMIDSSASAPDFRHSLSLAKQKIVDLGSYAMRLRDSKQVEQMEMGSKSVKA